MNYSKNCFSYNTYNTKLAKQAEEQEQDRMYLWIDENYPNYNKLDIRERMKIREEYKKEMKIKS